MIDISMEHFNRVKQVAIEIFQQNKRIVSPALWKIRLTPEWFNHIEWKNKNHKHSLREAFVRYLCFAHIVHILSNSKLYQEFREDAQIVPIKVNWSRRQENKIVRYYGFVAIVNNNKNRVKIVVRKVEWWNHYEYVSVIPAWKSTGYTGNHIFFEEDLSMFGENKN